MNSPSPELGETATRILTIASDWLDQNPGQQLTTRVVCALAGVTAPTLYHHFGDKDGLLQAVAERQLLSFFQRKRHQPETDDPQADLLRGWDQWLEFARQHRALIEALQQSSVISSRLRANAEAIAQARLVRLSKQKGLAISTELAASAMVAAANVIVQLMLQGYSDRQLRALNKRLQIALLASLTAEHTTP